MEDRLSPICIFRNGKWLYGGNSSTPDDPVQYREDDPSSTEVFTVKLSKSSYPWTGKAIKPSAKAYFGGNLLKAGTDYKVSYLNSKKKAIKASAVKAIGSYYVKVAGKGTARLLSFKIVKADQPIKHNLNSDTLRFKHKELKAGKTFTLTVKGVKESAPIKVTSDKPKIASVKKKSSGKYIVTPKKPGTAKIKVQTTKATKHYAKTTKTITVEVAALKKPTITVAKTIKKDIKDPAFNLNAKASGSMPITYKSNNEKIATVDKKGKVTLTGKQGTATITLSVKGNDFFKAGSTNVTIKVISISLKDPSVYLRQKPGSSNCTLYALANMMRRKAILDGRSDWAKIGNGIEDASSAFAKAAWVQGGGLNSTIKYEFVKGYTLNAHSKSFLTEKEKEAKLPTKKKAALVKERLIELLEKHPEGIECYDTGVPHAVLVTSYDAKTDTFYCFDSGLLTEKGKKIIKLSDSSLGIAHSNNQNSALAALGKYWYLK